jgi:hypothetical protein
LAAALYLVTIANSHQPNKQLVNRVIGAIVNADDGGTSADTIVDAETAIQAAGIAIPDGYFNTVQLLGLPTGGVMTTDTDVIVLHDRGKTESIA